MCDNTVALVLPAAESTPFEMTPTAIPRACEIILIDVRLQEDYLNLHVQYLAETSVQAAFTEVQQEIYQENHGDEEIADLSKQAE